MMTKNRPALLEEAVGSALAQTFGDFEIVISDDWSDPPASLEQLGVSDRRVRIVRPSAPAGGAGAKCFGVLQARGEILAFLDDDDLFDPAYVQAALEALAREPDVDVVFMGVEAFGKGAEHQNENWRRGLDRILALAGHDSRPGGLHVFRSGLLEACLEVGLPMAFQRPVASRAVCAKAGDYAGAVIYWDNEWTLRVLREGCRAALLDRPLYRQRLNPAAGMSNRDEREHARRNIAVLEKIYGECPPSHSSGPAFRRALAQAYFDYGYALKAAGARRSALGAYWKSQRAAFDAGRLKAFLGLLRP
jgi:glycosyltransferase involved in cell wall biosynthesis